MNTPSTRHHRDHGAASSNALTWVASLLAVTTVVAGLGWAGVIGGGDSAAPTTTTTTVVSSTTTTTVVLTEWPGTASAEVTLHGCPAGEVVGHVLAGDTVTVIGRAEGNAWLAINDPIDPSVTVWMPAAGLAPDASAPVWGDLPLVECQLESAEPIQYFRGQVRDSVSGVPLGGVSVAPTDPAGAPLPAYGVTTAADGSYELTGLVDASYGIWVDGAAVGYEQGFTGKLVSPIGFVVWPTFAEATSAAPGTIGDIALDSTGEPTFATTTTTTVPGATAPPTTLVPGVNVPPVIGALTATPDTIYSQPEANECTTISTVLSVEIVDASGLESVKVRWSYKSYYGTRTMYRVGTSNNWQATLDHLVDPMVPRPVVLEVTATDTEGLVATQTFPNSLTVKKC